MGDIVQVFRTRLYNATKTKKGGIPDSYTFSMRRTTAEISCSTMQHNSMFGEARLLEKA